MATDELWQVEGNVVQGDEDGTGGTIISSDWFNRIARAAPNYGKNSLRAIGGGVLPFPDANSFAVAVSSGRILSIGEGLAIAILAGTPHGAVPIYNPAGTTFTLPDNTTGYLFPIPTLNNDLSLPDARDTGALSFVTDSSPTAKNSIPPIAKFTTLSGAVTVLKDLRPTERLASTDMFAVDRATTTGLVVGTLAGVTHENDGTLHLVAPTTTTLAASTTNQILRVEDATGDITVDITTPDPTTHTALWLLDTDANSITRLVKLFPAAGAGGSGDVASVGVSGGLTNTGTSTNPVVTLPDGAATDAKIGNRTVDQTLATPGNTGPLLSLLSWLAGRIVAIMGTTHWYDAPGTTLAATATHIAAAAPHTGHTKADGSVAFSGDQSMGGNKLTNVGTPTSGTDAVTKAYVDAVAANLKPYPFVQVASSGNVNISSPGTSTFNGVTLTSGQSLLLWLQTTNTENGVYTFNGPSSAMTRRSDLDSTGELAVGAYVFALAGIDYKGYGFTIYSAGTMGTDPILWTIFTASGAGEANTASNAGSGAGLLFKIKSGVDLGFRTLNALSTRLSVATNTDTVDVDVVEANLDVANMGGTLGPTHGGTGLTAAAIGSLLAASATNVWATLNNTTTTRKFPVLIGNGTDPLATTLDTIQPGDLPVMQAGSGHQAGIVADPGGVIDLSKFIRMDGVPATPSVFSPAVVTLADAAPIAITPSAGNIFKCPSAVNRTLDAPGGTLDEGKWFEFWWKNTSGSGRALTLNGAYALSANVSALPTVPAGKTLLIAFRVIDGVATAMAYNLTV